MPLSLPEDRPRLEVSLDDGTKAELSPLLPEDRDLLAEGMSQLSPESRFTRFGLGRGDLTSRELDYLTVVDQRRHVAWGAIVGGAAGGVSRYIVQDDGCAETAVTVVDRFQRRGLGRALFRALVAVARADGVDQLCFEAVPGNLAVQRVLRGIPFRLDRDQGLVIGRVSVGDIPVSDREAEMVGVLEEVRAGQPASGSSSSEAELTQ